MSTLSLDVMKFKAQKTQVQGTVQQEQSEPGVDKREAGYTPLSTFSCHGMNQNASAVPVSSTTPTAVDGLAQNLVVAVQAGLAEKASELARELANLNVKCEIKVLHEINHQHNKQAEFLVKVHVEDRVADRCFVTIKVRAFDTIADLKRKMMILHNLPMEVQRWIIGKKIHPDNTTLYQCGVRTAGHTLYLYLVTARSVGLSKEKYDAQIQTIMLMKQASSQVSQQSLPQTTNQSVSFDPASCGEIQGATLNPSNPSSGSNGDSMDQTTVVPLRERPGFYPSSSSVSPGSMRLQEMLQSPNLSGFAPNTPSGTPGTPVENVLTHASPGLGAEAWAHNSRAVLPTNPLVSASSSVISNIALQASNLPSFTPGPPTEDDEQGEGWECPDCTYRNLPMWPGCEMCDRQRPEEYQVPEKYKMTEREIQLLHNEHMAMHERQGYGPNLPRQDEHIGRPAKLHGNFELLQHLQATQFMPPNATTSSDGSDNNIDCVSDTFVSDNSIVLRNLSDEQEDKDLRTISPQSALDLSGFPQAFLYPDFQPSMTSAYRPIDENHTPYVQDAIYGPDTSDEENSHA